MPYQQSLEIEQRLARVLSLVAEGQYATPGLAQELGVSIPTISRIIAVLRARGHDIQVERDQAGNFRYFLPEANGGHFARAAMGGARG